MADGKDIVYTITEDKLADYDTEIDGFVIKNTYGVPDTGDHSRTGLWALCHQALTLAHGNGSLSQERGRRKGLKSRRITGYSE